MACYQQRIIIHIIIITSPTFGVAGKNDGSVKGVRYFRCRNQHGVFVRHDKLIHDKKRSSTGNKSSGPAAKVAGKTSTLRRSTGNLSGSPSPGTATAYTSSLLKPTTASAAKHKWKLAVGFKTSYSHFNQRLIVFGLRLSVATYVTIVFCVSCITRRVS